MIAIKRRDGGFSWMWLAEDADVGAEIEKWRSIHGADYVSHESIDDKSAPKDWNFIEAWEPIGGRVSINIGKAREFCHKVRRQFRDQELAPLDAEIAKQIPGFDFSKVESKRQSIRDKYATLQLKIESAKSPEELSAMMTGYRP